MLTGTFKKSGRLRLGSAVRLVPVFLVIAAAASAQTAIPEKLTLADAVSITLETNVNLKSALFNKFVSESDLRVAELNTTYSLSGAASVQNSTGGTENSGYVSGRLSYEGLGGTEGSVSFSPYGTGDYQGWFDLELRQPLTKGKGVLSGKSDILLSARSSLRNRDRQLFQSRQSTVYSVIQSYCRALQAREQVKIQERALDLAIASSEYAKKREEAGIGLGIDAIRAEVQVEQTRERLNQRRSSARASIDQLMTAIGVGIGYNPELADSIPEIDETVPGLEEAVAAALTNRTELAVFDEQLATQQRRLRITEDDLRPGVDAVLSYSSSASGEGWMSSPFDDGTAVAGVEITIPLDRRALTEERDVASENLKLLGEQRTYQKERIEEEVRSAYRTFESAGDSLEILVRNLDVAKQNLYIAERMFEEGEYENREVLTAQAAVTDAESGLITARIDRYLALVALKRAMGEDLTVMGLK